MQVVGWDRISPFFRGSWEVHALTSRIGCVIVILILTACQASPPADERDRIVSSIDDHPLTVQDFEASYINFLIRTGQNDTPQNRYLHLSALVDASLLADEGQRRAYGSDSLFGVVVERAKRKAIGGRFFEQAFIETLPPLEDAEVRQAFARSKQQVVVRHLFYLRQPDADAAYARLQAGRSFLEEAVDCYNLTAIDSTAGYLGPIRYFQVDDAFAEAAFALNEGEYSAPVRSRFGFHIILVEDKYGTPIITESEYQTRREGMMSQVALRTRRLEGDRFVRGFMEGLDVQVNAPAVRSLAQAIQSIENRVTPAPVEVNLGVETVQVDLRALQQELTPDTPLATYVLGTDTLTFTARDYYFWLPDIPFSEARHRTSASVGRALRNEALYRAGEERNLASDTQVVADIDRARRNELTRRMRDSVRFAPSQPIAEADLRRAFDRSPTARQRRWTADFWTITFSSQADAEKAQQQLTNTPALAEDYPSYSKYTAQRLSAVPEWSSTIRQAPVRRISLAKQASGTWALIYVDQRTAETPTFEAVRDSLAQTLAPRYTEYLLLQRLYEQATVQTDTLLFEQMMTLDAE